MALKGAAALPGGEGLEATACAAGRSGIARRVVCVCVCVWWGGGEILQRPLPSPRCLGGRAVLHSQTRTPQGVSIRTPLGTELGSEPWEAKFSTSREPGAFQAPFLLGGQGSVSLGEVGTRE